MPWCNPQLSKRIKQEEKHALTWTHSQLPIDNEVIGFGRESISFLNQQNH